MKPKYAKINCLVGDLVLSYLVDGDSPYIGMIISKNNRIYEIEWYVDDKKRHTTRCGLSMAQLQRKAYLEYREELTRG